MTESIHKKRYTQKQLTQIFALQGNRAHADFKFLWNNFTDNSSLRLSMTGYQYLTRVLEIKSYIFELSKPLSNKNLLQLERFFPGPYYYLSSASKFIVFDQVDAVWLELLQGDLPSYLNTLDT